MGPKGPKTANIKWSLFMSFKTAISLWKSSNTFFDYRANYLDIGNLFYQNKIYDLKTKFWKIIFGPKIFFLNLELKSVNSISSSFGKSLKRPIIFFFTNGTPNGPTGNQSILVSQIGKNTPIALCQNGNIVVKNFQHIFWQSTQIRVSYYFFLLTNRSYEPL